MFDKRIPDLPYNGLFPSNGLIPWYLPNDDTTYHLKGSDIIAGLMGPDDAWSPVYTYDNGDIVSDGGAVWVSNGVGNLGNPPGPASPFWTGGPPPTPPITGWPLTGSADLTGNTTIKGGLTKGITLGAGDDVNNIYYLEVHSKDGFNGKTDLYIYPNEFSASNETNDGDGYSNFNLNGSSVLMSGGSISEGGLIFMQLNYLNGFTVNASDGVTLNELMKATTNSVQVFHPLRLWETTSPPAASAHEGALIWSGSEIKFSDGATWNTLGNDPGWPLTGSADLTGSVIINGALSYGIALGQDDDVNEISSFQAHVTDGVSGKSNIFAFPSNPGMNASNQVGTTFGSVGASQTGASIGGGDTSGSANLNVDYGNGVVASIGGSPDFDNIKNIFTFNRGSTGTTAAGFGMSFNFFAQNDMVESYEILRETFFYSDPTQNAEDSTWNVKGSNNGALVDFLNVQGGLDNQVQVFGPLKHKSYTVAGVPAAASHTASTIYVSDESGGATIAFSDGANWRRVQDRAIIS
jgi:hypothetical protein